MCLFSAKLKRLFQFFLVSTLLIGSASAAQKPNLAQLRRNTIEQYVYLLGKGDYKTIPTLFAKNAQVIAWQGEPSSPTAMYTKLFTQLIKNPSTHLIDIFSSMQNQNAMIAVFDLKWQTMTNKTGHTIFMDLIYFKPQSSKIEKLYIYNNLAKNVMLDF